MFPTSFSCKVVHKTSLRLMLGAREEDRQGAGGAVPCLWPRAEAWSALFSCRGACLCAWSVGPKTLPLQGHRLIIRLISHPLLRPGLRRLRAREPCEGCDPGLIQGSPSLSSCVKFLILGFFFPVSRIPPCSSTPPQVRRALEFQPRLPVPPHTCYLNLQEGENREVP